VSNAPLRERFYELQRLEDLTTVEVAARAGWWRRKTHHGRLSQWPDEAKVRHWLGLRTTSTNRRLATGDTKRYVGRPANTVHYDNAVLLARALHMDPHEAGV
jgi:hypothetical protein